MCVSPGALLSALLYRMDHEQYRPTEEDLRGLLGSGCREEQLRRALEGRQGPAFAEALERLAGMTGR